jgi:hypothetical protein
VKIAARHRELQLELIDATEKWRASGEFDDICKVTAARRTLDEYEAKLEVLAELRRSLADKRAAAKAVKDEAAPEHEAPEPTDVLYGRDANGQGTTRPSPFA